MLPSTETPFQQFYDQDGSPLDEGYVYIGLIDQNPETAQAPVFWDVDGTQPVAQPIRTLNGYPVRFGTPSALYAPNAYSLTVKNKRQGLVYYAPDSSKYSSKFFKLNATGAVTRSMLDKLADFVSVKDFGAVGDGVADDTVAIQTALNSFPAAGGQLYFPIGTYKVSSALTVAKPILVRGAGYSSNIRTSHTTENVFTVTSGFVVIEQLRITSSVVRAGGWYIDFTSATSRVRASDIDMDGFVGGIRTNAIATCTIERGNFLNGVAAIATAVRIDSGFDISVRDIVVDAAANIFAGVMITNAGDVTIEDSNIIHGGQALYLNPSAAQSITSVFANNTFFDTSTRGMYALASGGIIARCMFEQCWFSGAANQGALLATSGGGTINGLYFSGCEFFLNGSNGLQINDTGVTNVSVRDGAAAANTGAGYYFAANVSDFSVIGVRSGATDGLAGNVNGIEVAAGTGANYTLANNMLRSNSANSILDGGTGTGRHVVGNAEYDSGRSTFDPPNLVDGAGFNITVSVVGAQMGDFAQASFSSDLQGIVVTAWVQSAGVVGIRFQNETGGAIDLASGTLRARITRSS